MWPHFPQKPGRSKISERMPRFLRLVLLCLLLSGCNYGFEGGGFPSNVRTIYIEPFDLERDVTEFALRQQLYDLLVDEIPSSLGVQTAGRENADAILSGSIMRYDVTSGNYRPGEGGASVDVVERQVQIAIRIEILDVEGNRILWDSSSLLGRGAYRPDAQSEQDGQLEALDNLVQLIVDGAQSQW